MIGKLAPELKTLARRVRAARIRRARADCASFCEYVLRDEATGGPITLSPMHVEWHTDLDGNDRHMIWSHVEAGKTSQISVGRILFKLGRNPNKRLVIVCNSLGAARKIITLIGRYIETSKQLREVFPHLRPSTPWTQTTLTVERKTFSKDPSVQALGIGSDVIGSRIDDVTLDDLLDYENTRTAERRLETREWLKASILGRLTAGAPVAAVGNAFYADDVYHWLAGEMGYSWKKYPVTLDDGSPRWPEQWTLARIAKAAETLGGIETPEAQRQLFCIDRSNESARCKEEWIQQCLERGLGIPVVARVSEEEIAESGGTSHTGVDLGVKKHRKAAKSVVFSILSYPPEPGKKYSDRQVLNVAAGRWGAREIVQRALGAVDAFKSTVHVEDNGAQSYILDIAHGEVSDDLGDKGSALLVLPFHTGGNKTHPVIGVESVFAELARSQWIIPSVEGPNGKLVGATDEIVEWCAQCLNYAPESHTGDSLMASWFAKEGARLQAQAPREASVRIIGADVTDVTQRVPGTKLREDLDGWQALLRPDRR